MQMMVPRRTALRSFRFLAAAALALIVHASAPAQDAPPAPAAKPTPSAAERIIELRKSLEHDRAQLAEIQATFDDPESEYAQTEQEFKALDARLEELKAALAAIPAGDEASTRTLALKEERANLAERHGLAKERFGLAIEDRKNLRARRDLLADNIRNAEQQLARLEGVDVATLASPSPTPAPTPAPTPSEATPFAEGSSVPQSSLFPSPSPSPTPTPAPATTPEPTPAPTPAPAASPPPAPPVPPMVAAVQASASPSPAPTPAAAAVPKPEKTPSKEQLEAQKQAEKKEQEAEEAAQEVEDIAGRVAKLEESIELQRRQVDNSRQKVENARATRRLQQSTLEERRAQGAPTAELEDLKASLAKADERLREAQNELQARQAELQSLQSNLNAAQAGQLRALQEAERKREEAEKAQKRVQWLESVLYWPNLKAWLLSNGLKIAGILLAVLAFHAVMPAIRKKLLFRFAESGEGSASERMARARTLVSVIHKTLLALVDFAAGLAILNYLGIPAGALFGGAAIGGLAVAFGAQNLIRDFFTGIVILAENQYSINDVVSIGGKTGVVENITLRMTALRSIDGAVHFIPNGQIDMVSNLTYGWSRAVFDVGVAYKESADHVIGLIEEVGREMREDPKFKRIILEDLTMLGVDQMADSAIVIKFFIKTKPLEQWGVKREMLRRLKKRFDAEGVEIPFPQRTVYHRVEPGELSAKLMGAMCGAPDPDILLGGEESEGWEASGASAQTPREEPPAASREAPAPGSNKGGGRKGGRKR